MEITNKNQEIAIREQAELKLKISEENNRKEYFKGLKKDVNFQKWVVDGIIRKRINEINNLDSINLNDIASLDFEKIGRKALVVKMVKAEIEDMFAEVI